MASKYRYYKPIILLVSFVTFVWIVSSSDLNALKNDYSSVNVKIEIIEKKSSEIRKPLKVVEDRNKLKYDIVWDEYTVQMYQDLLGVSDAEYDENYVCDKSPLTGFPCDNFGDTLWQYFSLWAIEQMKFKKINVFLTNQTKTELLKVFETVPMNTIDTVSKDCYKLENAKILGDVSVIDEKVLENDILILEAGTKRHQNLINVDFEDFRSVFQRFDPDVTDHAEKILRETHEIFQMSQAAEINFIGVDLLDEQAPPAFYLKAMEAFRKILQLPIFIVLCSIENRHFCRTTFIVDDTRLLLPGDHNSTEIQNFVLMSKCNHTIVSNNINVLSALINGGMTIYRNIENQYYIPRKYGKKLSNWYKNDHF